MQRLAKEDSAPVRFNLTTEQKYGKKGVGEQLLPSKVREILECNAITYKSSYLMFERTKSWVYVTQPGETDFVQDASRWKTFKELREISINEYDNQRVEEAKKRKRGTIRQRRIRVS